MYRPEDGGAQAGLQLIQQVRSQHLINGALVVFCGTKDAHQNRKAVSSIDTNAVVTASENVLLQRMFMKN